MNEPYGVEIIIKRNLLNKIIRSSGNELQYKLVANLHESATHFHYSHVVIVFSPDECGFKSYTDVNQYPGVSKGAPPNLQN